VYCRNKDFPVYLLKRLLGIIDTSNTDKLFQEKNYIDKNIVCFIKKGPFLDTLNYICRKRGIRG